MPTSFPDDLAGFPFWPLEFDKKARPVHPQQVDRMRSDVSRSRVSHLLVLSHGWNNDEVEALRLYDRLLTSIARQQEGRLHDRRVGVAGVFWPSKKFADSDVIPGGAAALAGDLPVADLVAEIEGRRSSFDGDSSDRILDELVALAPRLENDPGARRRFGELAQQLPGDDWHPDGEVDDEIPAGLFTMPGEELIDALSFPREEETRVTGGGEGGIAAASVNGDRFAAEGGAAFLGSVFSGVRSGARNALNLITYYQMKNRAGVVGSTALGPILRSLGGRRQELGVHLVGHSFGGRLVTAAVHGTQSDRVLPARSMVLLQAAFSHNGFARDFEPGKNGFFRKVVAEAPGLPGPILVTHTSRDLPNRWAYPMASRLARQKAAFFGGPDDVYGAMGSNGAQHTPEAVNGRLLEVGGSYRLSPGKVHNLESSTHIAGHARVTVPEVAHALISSVVSGGDS